MANLSAAELQQKHNSLEGAPDPFPSLLDNGPRKPKAAPQANGNGTLDNSESSFPSLASNAASSKAPSSSKPSSSSWGAGSSALRRPAKILQPVYSSNFTLDKTELAPGHDGKTAPLGNVMKDVMNKTKTKIEASTQRTTGGTTFHIKGDSEAAVDAAIRTITAALSPRVTLVVNAPVSIIGTIIGPKGATLNKMREETGNSVKVDIPRREPSVLDTTAKFIDEEEEEATVPITISGPSSLAEDVRTEIQAIISSKKSKSTQRVKGLAVHVVPFIAFQREHFASEDIVVAINDEEGEVTVSGEREAVIKAVDAIKARVEQLTESLESTTMTIPKRQHRLFHGAAATSLLARTRCVVIPVASTEPGDEVTIWGLSDDIPGALGAVFEQARSKTVVQVTLPQPLAYATQVRTYITRSGYIKAILADNPGVEAHISPPELSEKTGSVFVDLIGTDKANVESSKKELGGLIRNLEGALREVEIDWLVHKTLIGRAGKKIKQFQEQHNVLLYFPPESSESSLVLLVHDPLNLSPAAPLSPAQKQAHLDEVQKELVKLAADAADTKTVRITVEAKWHSAVVGKAGTTLNAIIGEEKLLSIKVGAQAKLGPGAPPLGVDEILIRGPSSEVDRAVTEINRIVDDAKNDEIDNGFSTEFEVGREHIPHVVGAGGAGVGRLREALGVNVDFSDEPEDKAVDGTGKAKRKKSPQTKVKITGRKENVEEAKRRILSQVERLADETQEILKIPRSLHAGLIGQGGKYVIRLEEKYSVKITFPRDTEDTGSDEGRGTRREALKLDEVLIKGGKKGVSGAKVEILEAVEFEKESNHTAKFTVPTRAVARILGKGGASIIAIKDDTGAKIDVEKPSDNDFSKDTTINLKGTKKAIAAAKEMILAISSEVSDEVTEVVHIEHKFHRSIIGAGGQNLRDLIAQAGGLSDVRHQAGLIHFPRQDEPADEVRLRGPKALVTRLKAALEKSAKEHRDKIVRGVSVPAVQHRALIGRGGQNLNDLQSRHSVTVQFPGSRSYNIVGEPSNAADLDNVLPEDLVKVTGPSAGVAKAIQELSAAVTKASATESRTPRISLTSASATATVTATLTIPLKYHHTMTFQNNLYRTLRTQGVTVEQSRLPEKPVQSRLPATNGAGARIDDNNEDDGVEWHVVENYQDAEEGDSEWTLKARDDEALKDGKRIVNDALEHAQSASHVGYLTLADRSVFPRIVGTKGANVARLRAETGTNITVGREDNTIVIVGAEGAIQEAKEAILKTVQNRSRGDR